MFTNVVGTIASGPVGGVVASSYLGRLLGHRNIICTDVGGTSFDVAIIHEGQPLTKGENVVGQYRFTLPMIDITSIGAGGGSIAWVQPPGLLKVGPQSAGSTPGPACYGRGGTKPTASDACALLGYLDPDNFWGGRLRLDIGRAEQAIAEVAAQLKMNVADVAVGIYEIVSIAMGDLISTNTIGRGYDPKDFAIYIYGGAGGLFGAAYSREIRGQQVVVVPFPEAFSAFGISITDIKHVYEQTSPTTALDIEVMNKVFEQSAARAREQLRSENVADDEIVLLHSVGVKYRAQIHELLIPVPSRRLTEADLPQLIDRFDATYEAVYGKGAAYKEAGRESMTLRLEAIGRLSHFPFVEQPAGNGDAGRARRGQRRAYWKDAGGFVATNIFDGPKLLPADRLAGPAIIEMPNTTVLVPPRTVASLGHYREIYLTEDTNA
jgi:N-methylhydantoinase A